jgi:hypothetical protein
MTQRKPIWERHKMEREELRRQMLDEAIAAIAKLGTIATLGWGLNEALIILTQLRDTPPVAPVDGPFTAEQVEELAAWMDSSPFRQRTMDTVPMLRYLAALLRQQEGR